ncbi:DUF7927 domain-containing protein [Leucobacter komagatae]|uniref:DUF7927 domain-containing protein n=1 Tax=Leucobacter komagatae TaxID=55969 RepID=A0A0D0ITE3_9MICO|nr:isopeptide-forming domain-containing fimbrial protein [Leucobacter komagatae]KIP52778.1 hypothetical protein SD72_07465 [Leucobacter komagatae]
MRVGIASVATAALFGGMLIAAPGAAMAATTTADITPFDATNSDRYTEVAQFGADVAGSDTARTGYDVELSGDSVIFTQQRGTKQPGSGLVTVRTWEGPGAGDFAETQLVTPADAKGFGYSVDIDEAAGIAIVGARYSQEVYVYTEVDGDWTTTPTKITPAGDPRVAEVRSFGESVSLSGSHVVIGAPNSRVDGKANAGAAYSVSVSAIVGADAVAAPMLLPTGGVNVDDVYGQIVATAGDLAVVSAAQHREIAGDGNAYQVGQISSWNIASGSLNFTVSPDVNQANVAFPPALEGGSWAGLGRAIAITADGRIVAGSPSEVSFEGTEPGDIATDTTTTQGAVYVYNGDGTLAGKSLSAAPHQYYFGSTLDLNETTSELFVGALNLDGTPNTGTVQLFEVSGPASTTAIKPLATKDGGESMFGTFGILGGAVRAGTAVGDDGVQRHRAVVSASGNVYVFTGINAVTLTKTTSLAPGNASPSAIEGRNVAEYTISLENTTGAALENFTLTDDLSNVIDDAEVSDVVASTGTATLDGDKITWTGDLAAGEAFTITYTATVKSEVVADDEDVQEFTEPVAALVNTVTTTKRVGDETTEVPSVRDAADAADREKWTGGLTVTTPIDGALLLEKTATDEDENGLASPGERVSYTVTARNVGGLPLADASVTDDLTELLQFAGSPENIVVSMQDRDGNDLAAPEASYAEPLLSWRGDVPAGATVTITYEVTTKTAEELYPLAGGEALVNGVESPENVDPEGPTTVIPVEDELTLEKSATPASGTIVKPGDTIDYTLTLTNKDAVAAKQNVTVTDDLSAVLPYAKLVGTPSEGATVAGSILTWQGDVAAGEIVTITYSVRVLDSAPNGQRIGNHAASAQVREDPPGTTHEVENPRGKVELQKNSDPASGSQVLPGSTITYTVSATNDTELDMEDVVLEDVVSGPATVVAASLPAGAVLDGNTIRWTGTVPAQETVTLSYEVTVNADATAPAVIGNVVTSPDMENDPENPPTTEHPVRTIDLEKVSTPASGATVQSGDVITYTVVAKNPSAVDFDDVTVIDDLSGVLGNATLIEPVAPGVFDPVAKTISWTGGIAAGAAITFTYQVKVNEVISPEGAVLRNVVTSPDSPTSPETTHPTDNPRGQVTLAKTSDPTSGSTVRPGEAITYTVTVTNDTPRVIRDVRVVDDVTSVLANATIDTASLPAGMTLSGNELVWVGDVAGNSSVELSYVATVNDDATAPAVLKNVVTSTDMTNDPEDPPVTEHPVGSIELAKTSTPGAGTAVKVGDIVTYQVSIRNAADAPLTGVVVTDDLSDVLDSATLESGPDGGATIDGTTITWAGDLAPREEVLVSYSVRVNEGVFEGALRNVVSSPDSPITPETEHPIGAVTLAKSTDVPAGTAVNRGEPLTYTVTVTNTSGVDVAGASLTDNLSDVFDNATLVPGSLNVVGGGNAEIVGETLSWTGDVANGATVTISYTVVVNEDVAAGEVLRNHVASPVSPEEPETETPVGVVGLEKQSVVSPAGPAKPGSEITYTVTVKNPSAVDVNGVDVYDNLNDVLAHAVVTTEPSASSGEVTRDAGQLHWKGDVPAGQNVTITYVVKVNDTITPPVTLRNVAWSPDSPEKPETENPIGSLGLEKSTDVPAGSTVRIGDEITYTVKITNDSGADLKDVSVADDLSDVLDNATLQGNAEIVSGGGALELKQNTLTWTGDVASGGTVEIRYTVKVNDDVQGEQQLRNVVTSPDSPVTPETVNPIGSVELVKMSDPAAGAGVKPGDAVSYTVTVRNTSGVDLTGVTAVDDLARVLPYASMQGEPEVIEGGGTASLDVDAQTITWIGDLAAGQEARISYTVVVNSDAESGNVLRNLVTSPDSPDEPSVKHPVTTIGLEKTVSPASGSSVRPGQEVFYTITAKNTTDTDATLVSITDDVSDILDDATLLERDIAVSDGSTAALVGSSISWNGTVPSHGEIVITYKVTVNDDALAPATLRNVVTSPHSTDEPETENPVGSLLLSKINDKGDGTVVKPGEKVTYSVTITNPSAAALDDVTVSDDLSDVLGNASWNDDAVPSAGDVSLDGETMRWTGSVPANGAVTITYSVTVKDTAEAPAKIRNAVTSPDSPNTPGIENPVGTVNLAKSSVPKSGETVKPGSTVAYTITVTNPSGSEQEGVRVVDNLSQVLSSAVLEGTPQVSDGSSATVTGNELSWTGTVPANGSIEITYLVRVLDEVTAPAVLRNLVTSPDSDDTPSTENPVGTVVLEKVSDVGDGTAVKPGESVTYTVTVKNPVDAAIADVRVVDQLAGVLGAADLVGGPESYSGDVRYDADTQEIVWSGDLAAKQIVAITYTVKVKESASQGDVLRNRVVSPDSPIIPETENPVGDIVTAKRLLDERGNPVGSGTIVAPGQQLTYELTAMNGMTSDERVSLRDDLSDVLSAAQLVTGPEARWTAGGEVPAVAFENQVISWDHEIPAGHTVTISYTVLTDPKSDGTAVLSNKLFVDDEEGPGTENPVGTLRITKDVTPASGTAVKPGETVTYTVTAQNTSNVDIAGASISDDLRDVLDNATLVGEAEASDGTPVTIDGNQQLQWRGDVPANGSVTLTYSVTVNKDALAPAVLRNLVTSPNSPDEPDTENPVGTVSLSKSTVPGDGVAVRPGDDVTYSVTVRNTTAAPIHNVSVTDDLADIVDNAVLDRESVAVSDGSTATVAADRISWNGTVPADSEIVITYVVTVNKDATAPQVLRNIVTSPDSPEIPEVVNPVGTLRLAKTSVPGDGVAVKPGDTVEYTVLIANDAAAPLEGATVTDDLSDVFDNATLVGDPVASSGAVSLEGTDLIWSGDVPANDVVTLTYSVRVNDDAFAPAVLRNVVSSPDSPVDPETTNPVATVVLGKSSNPTSGVAVKPGDTVDYTVTVTNPGDADIAGVHVEDNLSDILDDASLIGSPKVSDGSKAHLNGMSLSWTGMVPAGETVTITYSVLVSSTAVPPATLRNLVTSPQSPEKPVTENPVGVVNLVKTSDPQSGSAVGRGERVNYTVTVSNPTPYGLSDVSFEDDLADVLDDAVLVGEPVAPAGTTVEIKGTKLTWSGSVPALSTLEIRYTVQVKETAVAPATLKNLVLSPHSPDKPVTENPVTPLNPGETIPMTGGDIAPLIILGLLALLGGGLLLARNKRSRVEGADIA